jgi:hypothetical protein
MSKTILLHIRDISYICDSGYLSHLFITELITSPDDIFFSYWFPPEDSFANLLYKGGADEGGGGFLLCFSNRHHESRYRESSQIEKVRVLTKRIMHVTIAQDEIVATDHSE